MSFLSKFFKKDREDVEIVSRKPVGKFRVKKSLKIFGRQVLIGEVFEGIIYPGYKLRGKTVGIVMKIEMEKREADFAVAGDEVALMLENEIPCKKGDELEIYQS